MKNSWKLLGLVLACQCAFSVGVRADEKATRRLTASALQINAIAAKYQFLRQAYLDVNSEDIERQLAPGFTAKKSGNRNVNREQFIADQRELMSAISKVNQLTLRVNKVWIDGNRATVILSQVYDFDIKGTNGRTHRLKEKSVCRDFWAQESGQWKNVRSEFLNGLTTHFYQSSEGDAETIKAQIAENYLLWQEAYKNKDAGRIISFESPDFTRVSLEGSVSSKDKADENARELLHVIQKVHGARMEIKKLRIEPNRVVILSNLFLDANMRLGDPVRRVVITGQARDIWVQYDGIWMLKRTEHLGLTINGQPQE